jgi:hypothetical protein
VTQAERSSTATRVALAAALAIPWLFVWQGLDVMDQGFELTNYRLFFRAPLAMGSAAHIWLTNLVGALWDTLFHGLGVLGQRVLWAGVLSTCLLAAFTTTRELTSVNVATLATLVTALFLADRRETWFTYNTLSILLDTLAAACMVRAQLRRHAGWAVAAGVCAGMAPFARLPNILLVAIGSAPLFAALVDRGQRPRVGRTVGAFLLGYAAGAALVLGLIYALGQQAQYRSAVAALFSPAAAAGTHSSHRLLYLLIRDHSRALAAGLLTCVCLPLLVHVALQLAGMARFAVLLAAAALGIWVLARNGEPWCWFVPGTVYVILAAICLGWGARSIEVRVGAWVALVVVLVAPLGSDNGILNAHMGLWFALPLTLGCLYTTPNRGFFTHTAPSLALVLGCSLVGEGIHRAATYTYLDAPRRQLLWPTHDPLLRMQFTTAERARVLDETAQALRARVQPGDLLLAYEGTNLFYYLSDTRPYTNSAWMMEDLPPLLPPKLDIALAQHGCLPVAIRSLGSARSFTWPQLVSRGPDLKEPYVSNRATIERFLHDHRYTVRWHDDFFEILEPGDGSAGSRRCR